MLHGLAYWNNSIVAINDIGEWNITSREGDSALLCVTDKPDCCKPRNGSLQGEFYYPNNSMVRNQASEDIVLQKQRSTSDSSQHAGGMMISHQLEDTDVRFLTPMEWIKVSTSISQVWEWFILILIVTFYDNVVQWNLSYGHSQTERSTSLQLVNTASVTDWFYYRTSDKATSVLWPANSEFAPFSKFSPWSATNSHPLLDTPHTINYWHSYVHVDLIKFQ